MYRLFAAIVFILTTFVICYSAEKYKGGPHYFRDVKNETASYEPVEEINYEEANNLYTYYEAYFDNQGRMISLKKYLKGALEQELITSDKK